MNEFACLVLYSYEYDFQINLIYINNYDADKFNLCDARRRSVDT